jgi:hypothetical protein
MGVQCLKWGTVVVVPHTQWGVGLLGESLSVLLCFFTLCYQAGIFIMCLVGGCHTGCRAAASAGLWHCIEQSLHIWLLNPDCQPHWLC